SRSSRARATDGSTRSVRCSRADAWMRGCAGCSPPRRGREALMTMNTVFIDSTATDDERRRQIYDGQLFVSSKRPSVEALAAFAQRMVEEAFAPLDPRTAQDHLPVRDYVAILAKLKPAFIHHPMSKSLIRAVLREFGCDLEKTYFD